MIRFVSNNLTSSTCLDIIAVDESIGYSDYHVETEAASDHFPVSIQITATNAKPRPLIMNWSFTNVNLNELGLKAAAMNLTRKCRDLNECNLRQLAILESLQKHS
jgi:hypothetical protein